MKTLTDLPLEILQEISSRLPLKDSTALCGTCKTTFRINEIQYYFDYDEVEVERWSRRALENNSVQSFIKMTKDRRLTSELMSNILLLFVEKGLIEGLEILLMDERSNCYLVFFQACSAGNLAVVKMLLTNFRVNPSLFNNSAICRASESGHANVVRFLLQDITVDPSTGDNYPIRAASSCGHYEVVEALLGDPRVDPSARNNYAIREASSEGHYKVVELLIKDPRVDPTEAIRTSCTNGRQKEAESLHRD